jgi:RHS repeat-associated protein/uncharacterized delta-60 repeat protein
VKRPPARPDEVIPQSVGSLVTAEHVWSLFYVDAMIETDTNPQVTTNQSSGSVDSSFGVTNTSNHTTTTTLSYAVTSAVAAADGSDMIVATMVGTTPELLFYNASGGLDSSYGTSGVVTLSYLTSITGLVVQPDGDIDVSGNTSSGGLSVLQLNPSGTADSSFGSSGIETLTTLPAALGVIIADNGELLVDGVSGTNVTVTELNASTGAVDTSYGSSGTSSFSFNSSATSVGVIGMAESPTGELVLAGAFIYSTGGFGINSNRVLTELNASGGVDTTFGTSGIVTVSTGSALAPGYSPLAVTADGKILIGDAVQSGFSSPHSVTLKVTEYNSNGSLDTSFGTSGQASTGTISSDGSGLILNIQTNGQIVIGIGGTSGYFILARFDANGSLDSNFGSSGIKIGAADGMGLAMVTAANGETVMIGTPSSGNGILLQEFGTLASHQTLYVEYDADYNVTSLTDGSGNVLERYEYDPYGTVTVLSANGTVRGDGTAASSFFAWVYLDQGMRYTVLTDTYASETRIYGPSLGRWLTEDPKRYVNGADMYPLELSSPVDTVDPTGLAPPSSPSGQFPGPTNGAGSGQIGPSPAGRPGPNGTPATPPPPVTQTNGQVDPQANGGGQPAPQQQGNPATTSSSNAIITPAPQNQGGVFSVQAQINAAQAELATAYANKAAAERDHDQGAVDLENALIAQAKASIRESLQRQTAIKNRLIQLNSTTQPSDRSPANTTQPATTSPAPVQQQPAGPQAPATTQPIYISQ